MGSKLIQKDKYQVYMLQSKTKNWNWQDHSMCRGSEEEAKEKLAEFDGIPGYEFRLVKRTTVQTDELV